MMEMPKCELCGEEDASLQLSDAGVCDECFAKELRPTMKEQLGRHVCCEPVRRGGMLLMCLETYGTEHDHGSIPSAVNSHDALAEALEEVIALVVDDPPGGLQILPGDVAQSVRAALTLAKGA